MLTVHKWYQTISSIHYYLYLVFTWQNPINSLYKFFFALSFLLLFVQCIYRTCLYVQQANCNVPIRKSTAYSIYNDVDSMHNFYHGSYYLQFLIQFSFCFFSFSFSLYVFVVVDTVVGIRLCCLFGVRIKCAACVHHYQTGIGLESQKKRLREQRIILDYTTYYTRTIDKFASFFVFQSISFSLCSSIFFLIMIAITCEYLKHRKNVSMQMAHGQRAQCVSAVCALILHIL